MLKDRGNIKWTSLMLPEHVEKLKEMWREMEKMDKPILDEQALEEMNGQLLQAKKFCLPVLLKIYKDGAIQSFQGEIIDVCPQDHCITFKQIEGSEKNIAFEDMISIEIL